MSRNPNASRVRRDLRYGRAGLSRDPLAARVVIMLAGRRLGRDQLTRRCDVAPAKVGAVLDKLVQLGMVALRRGRRPRCEVDWARFAPWFAGMAAGPETREAGASARLPEPKLEIEVGEWGGWHPVVVWHSGAAKPKAPKVIGALGRHRAFRDLLERFLVWLAEDADPERVARGRFTLSDLARSFESVLLLAGPNLTADRSSRSRTLVPLLKQWHAWRMAVHTLPEQAWLETFAALKLLAPLASKRQRPRR
ncbi:MAG: hypothetical protein AAB152_07250 [Candidatus Coatesbacteria bacterium]